jgi:spore photoproduct lyase
MAKLTIEKIFIDKKLKEDRLVRKIVDRLPGRPVVLVDSGAQVEDEIRLSPDPIGQGKRVIYLTENRSFLRPCPCTPGCLSCGYWNIDLDQNCPLDCSYCILQAYLKGRPLTISVNRLDLEKEVKRFLSQKRKNTIRIGTGELTDSLALDWLTENSLFLVDLFKGAERCLLEFKTKTAAVENLLKIKPEANVVLAWSLNPEKVIAREEKGTASLLARLEAAKKAVNHGYRVGFHFDPIIHYEGWKEDYAEVVELIFKMVPAEAIFWVSLGTLRFPPNLPEAARFRFKESKLYEQEFIRSWDGKYRYPRPRRQKIYQEMIDIFCDYSLGEKIYLCMESPSVYEETLIKKIGGRYLITFPFFWLR